MDDLISRQEAIDAFYKHPNINWTTLDVLAKINALPSAQPDSKETSYTHKALDTISRQAAIDAHYEYCNKHPDASFPVWSLKILENLPSAQPETHEERTETHTCDLISRQAVIDSMEDVDWYHINKDGQLKHGANSKEDEPLYKAEDVYKVLNNMPSAQPEIVRCNDCRYNSNTCGNYVDCDIIPQMFGRTTDNFCSKAERRTDDQ